MIADSTTAVPTSSNEFQVASPTMSVTGRSVLNERAPVAVHEVAEPAHVLLGDRLVEVVLVLEVRDRLLGDRRLVPESAQRVTARGDEEEHHQRRQHDDGNRDQQAPYDVRDHRTRV